MNQTTLPLSSSNNFLDGERGTRSSHCRAERTQEGHAVLMKDKIPCLLRLTNWRAVSPMWLSKFKLINIK